MPKQKVQRVEIHDPANVGVINQFQLTIKYKEK